MMRYGHAGAGIGWGGWVAMVAMMVVLTVAIAWVVVTLIRQGGPRPASAAPTVRASADATQILAERFARGDIDEDEYRRRRDVLRGDP
jgi:putative membrane protein